MQSRLNDKNEGFQEDPDPHSLNSLLYDSSIHGVKYLSQRDRPVCERVTWLILIIASGIGAAYFVHGVMYQYYESPVIVSFQTSQTSIAQIPFPAVTVCNINRFRKSAFLRKISDAKKLQDDKAKALLANETEALKNITKQLVLTLKLLRAFDNICHAASSFHAQLNYSINETTSNIRDRGIDLEYDVKIRLKDVYDKSFVKFMEQSGLDQTCSEMILLCMWEGDPFNCSSSFQRRFTRYGSCCTFNMAPKHVLENTSYSYLFETNSKEERDWKTFDTDKHLRVEEHYGENLNQRRDYPRRQSKAGQRSGLSFLVNPEPDEYYCSGNSAFGFRVLTHPPTEIAKIKDFGLAIGPGVEVFMDLEADLTVAHESIKELSPETRYCYFSHEQPLELFSIYTQNNCIDECISKVVLANCSCIRFDLPTPAIDPDLPLCEGESLECSKKIRSDITRLAGNTEGLNKTLCKECFPSCNKIEYRIQASTLPLEVDPRIWTDENDQIASWANEKVSIVHVYFASDTVYSRLRKKLYGANDLIANIGGILGLFLGMSIIGIIEPVFYIIKLIYFKLKIRYTYKKDD